MTCKDCIYFNSTEHPKPEWTGYNKCEKHTADGYQEYVGKDAEICKDFEPKENSWEGDICELAKKFDIDRYYYW